MDCERPCVTSDFGSLSTDVKYRGPRHSPSSPLPGRHPKCEEGRE